MYFTTGNVHDIEKVSKNKGTHLILVYTGGFQKFGTEAQKSIKKH